MNRGVVKIKSELKRLTEQAGVDMESALARFMGNEMLFWQCFARFADDKNYAALFDAVSRRDAGRALTAAHTLKGVCGNLSMVRLEKLLGSQVAFFRAGDFSSAANLMPDISEAYESIIRVIQNQAFS